MHELKRRYFLESMGVDTYVSRGQLPGAALTQRLVVVRRSPKIDSPLEVQAGKTPVPVQSNTAAAFREAADTVKAQLGTATQVSPGTHAKPSSGEVVPPFSIAAVTAGGFLWLEQLTGPFVSRDQVHLIRAMAKALALPEGELDVSQFDWPIHKNTQLDLGAQAARAGLAGFVQRKLGLKQCRGLVFLGSASGEKLDTTQLEFEHCLTTVSTVEMLRDPQLKKQAWLDLASIAYPP